MALVTVIHRCLVYGSFVVAEDISPCLLLFQDTNVSVAVRMRGRSIIINLLHLCFCPFPFIFDLDCGQEFAPIFMVQVTIVLLIILQLVTHG